MRKAMVTLAMVALALGIAAGWAGGAVVDLTDDSNGMPDWQGIRQYTGQLMSVPVWDALVAYCVYEPGQFDESFGFDPDPTHYVYAYEIVELNGGFTTSTVDLMSVGLNGGDEEAANIGFVPHDPAPNLLDPTESSIDLTTFSAKWNWKPDPLRNGDVGPVLYFTSPNGPEWDTVRLQGWGGDTQLLPSPTPEPTSALLLAMGVVTLLRRKMRRSE